MPSTTKRPDRRFALLGGAAIGLALTVFLLLRPPARDAASVAALPAPLPPAPVAEAAPAPVAAPPSAEGLRLYGLLGFGAVIGLPDGRQRLVAIGREVVPGVRVRRIEPQSVVLASDGGEVRLGFDGARPIGAPADGAPAPVAGNEQAWRDETLTYRLGLAPRQVGTRVSGFTVRPGASLPKLEQAGLRPGDLILRVNGAEFGEEAMQELAWTMANSSRTDFEVVRDGRRVRLSLQH